jgi:hypothetical protein
MSILLFCLFQILSRGSQQRERINSINGLKHADRLTDSAVQIIYRPDSGISQTSPDFLWCCAQSDDLFPRHTPGNAHFQLFDVYRAILVYCSRGDKDAAAITVNHVLDQCC